MGEYTRRSAVLPLLIGGAILIALALVFTVSEFDCSDCDLRGRMRETKPWGVIMGWDCRDCEGDGEGTLLEMWMGPEDGVAPGYASVVGILE